MRNTLYILAGLVFAGACGGYVLHKRSGLLAQIAAANNTAGGLAGTIGTLGGDITQLNGVIGQLTSTIGNEQGQITSLTGKLAAQQAATVAEQKKNASDQKNLKKNEAKAGGLAFLGAIV